MNIYTYIQKTPLYALHFYTIKVIQIFNFLNYIIKELSSVLTEYFNVKTTNFKRMFQECYIKNKSVTKCLFLSQY